MFDWISLLKTYQDKREHVALVTVTKCMGSTPCQVGSRMIVDAKGVSYGTIGGGGLEYQVIQEALTAISQNRVIEVENTLGTKFEQCCGGKVQLIIEPMNQRPELFLFGAGHVGVELCQVLRNTDFDINLIDSREGWFEGWPKSDTVTPHWLDVENLDHWLDSHIRWGDQCYMVVMTHNHSIDLEIIARALKQPTRYLGLIGSDTKKMKFHRRLVDEFGIADGMNQVTCPMGIPIGGEQPREIAISIAAELVQLHAQQKIES